MTTIERHDTSDVEFSARRAAIHREDVDACLEVIVERPALLVDVWMSARDWVGQLSVCDPSSEEICRGLRIAGRAGAAVLARAVATSNVHLSIDGRECDLPPTGPTSRAHPGTFCEAFFIGLIVRDRVALDLLAGIPIDALRASPSVADEYLYGFARHLSALWRGEPDATSLLVSALEATDPDGPAITTPDEALNLAVPWMKLSMHFSLKDSIGFQQALTEALTLHRRYWRGETRCWDPRGFIAMGPLGIACLAYDNGVRVEVDSPYAPHWLVRGGCAVRPS